MQLRLPRKRQKALGHRALLLRGMVEMDSTRSTWSTSQVGAARKLRWGLASTLQTLPRKYQERRPQIGRCHWRDSVNIDAVNSGLLVSAFSVPVGFELEVVLLDSAVQLSIVTVGNNSRAIHRDTMPPYGSLLCRLVSLCSRLSSLYLHYQYKFLLS